MEESSGESEEEFQDSREDLPPEGPVDPSTLTGQNPTPAPSTSSAIIQPNASTHPVIQQGIKYGKGEDYCQGVQDNLDLIEDPKFYQDAALNYQNAYEALHIQKAELQAGTANRLI